MCAALSTAPAIASTFVRKLYRILDKQYPGIISWNEAGTAFSVFNLELFELHVMPLYFRGGRDAFHQQIREHDFKAVAIAGAVESYQHTDFVRGDPDKLLNIVRVQLPRRRTRRKKTAGAMPPLGNVAVKAEPLDWDAQDLAMLFADLEPPAGNSMKSHDILQWPDVPAVDALSDDDADAISGLAAGLTDEQLDMMMRVLTGGDGVGLVSLPPSCPVAPPVMSRETSTEFSADILHTLMEEFSTVPT